jgi:hypothetical protein
MHAPFQALHRFLRRWRKAVCTAATEFEFPRMVRFLLVITKILCPAWLTLPFFGLPFLEAKAGTGEELYQLAVRDLEACGTFFDQQGVPLPRGDAIFKRGRCIWSVDRVGGQDCSASAFADRDRAVSSGPGS